MDIEFCQAIYNNNVNCHYRAKHNGYCGIHASQCTDKTDINFCQGLTKCGKNCRKIVKYGNFCSTHKHSEKPDNFHISLYEPDVEWPDMNSVLYLVKKCNSGKDLDKRMKYIDENVHNYYFIFVIRLFHKLYIFVFLSTLKSSIFFEILLVSIFLTISFNSLNDLK